MTDPASPSAGERLRNRYMAARMSGFAKFVFGISIATMSVGFAMGVMEAASGNAPGNPGNGEGLLAGNPGPAPAPARPTPPAITDPRPEPPRPGPAKPNGTKPKPAAEKVPDPVLPPPVIVDDPTPDPEPPAIITPAPPKPPAVDPDDQGKEPLFEIPGVNDKTASLIEKGVKYQDQSSHYYDKFRETDSKADMDKAKQAIQQAIECYRQAAKASPKNRLIQEKLTEANRLHYRFMKSSKIF